MYACVCMREKGDKLMDTNNVNGVRSWVEILTKVLQWPTMHASDYKLRFFMPSHFLKFITGNDSLTLVKILVTEHDGP